MKLETYETRDLFLRDLSKYFKLNTYVDNRGSFVVNAEGVGSLVTAGQNLNYYKRCNKR